LGKPITPAIIKKIKQSLSDLIPGVVAVDLLATIKSNEFSDDFSTEKDQDTSYTWNSINYKETKEQDDYAFLGKIDNDKSILLVRSNDGGAMTTLDLVVLKIEVEKCWNEASKPRYRLLAKQIAYINLEDIAKEGKLAHEVKGKVLVIKNVKTNKSLTINLK